MKKPMDHGFHVAGQTGIARQVDREAIGERDNKTIGDSAVGANPVGGQVRLFRIRQERGRQITGMDGRDRRNLNARARSHAAQRPSSTGVDQCRARRRARNDQLVG